MPPLARSSSARPASPQSASPGPQARYTLSQQRGDLLRQRVREALSSANDGELQHVLQQRYHVVPDDRRLTQGQVIDMAARFLDTANLRLEARHAIIYLANANWDLEAAFRRYMAERYDPPNSRGPSPEEADEEELSMTDLSSEEEQEEGPNNPRSRLWRRNPHIDREPAIKGKSEPSKTVIKLRNIDGKKNIERHYGKPVDWDDPASIRDLNRWRQQYLRRLLGPAREERVRFHPDELRYLIQAHRNHLHEAQAHHRQVDWGAMDWDRIAVDFNNNFAGRTLGGSSCREVRPTRTAGALRSVRSRVPEIVQMTGLAARPGIKEMKKETEKQREKGKKDEENDENNGEKSDEGRKGDSGKRGSAGKK